MKKRYFKNSTMQLPLLGQLAICPDGLGRVLDYVDDFPTQWIQVRTYVDSRDCKWDPVNVDLIDPEKGDMVITVYEPREG